MALSEEAKRLRSAITIKLAEVMNDQFRAGRNYHPGVMDGPDHDADSRQGELDTLIDQLAALSVAQHIKGGNDGQA